MYSIEVHLVDYCNLNCKGCTHFCPLVTDKTPNNIDRILRDLIRLNAIKCTPNVLKLLGGEPLLHPNLTESLELFRGVLPNSDIIIWSNGILLPKMEPKFFENCRLYDIKIIITKYPVDGILKYQIERIVSDYEFIKFDDYFDGYFWKPPLSDNNSMNGIDTNYNRCRIKYGRCNILKDGRIYQCPLPAYIDIFNKHFRKEFNAGYQDYVDIYEIRDERDIINKIYKPTPFCDYCSAECGENFKWEQSKKDISEWLKV
jgi:MoaA/NifB/PqqE/SkfB family radical SAM enzyme